MEINERHNNFEKLKRDFEIAYLNDEDYTALVYALAKAIVFACLNKCVQVGSMHQTEYLIIKKQIESDYFASDSNNAANVENSSFFDGIDLMQETICLLLEQALAHGSEVGWLDKPYTTRIIASRARIKEADTAGYQEKTTTPLQECYRAIRRTIDKLQYTNGSHNQLSIDNLDASQLNALCMNSIKSTEPSENAHTTEWDYENLLQALNLTSRQECILTLRMQGYGYQAIATYLGVSKSTVTRTLDRLKDKCKAMGFEP